MNQGTPGGADAFGRLQRGDGQVRPRRVDAIDQPQFGARLVELRAAASSTRSARPIAGCGNRRSGRGSAARPRRRPAAGPSASRARPGLGGRLRDVHRLAVVGQRSAKSAADRLLGAGRPGCPRPGRSTRENRSRVNVCGCVSRPAAAAMRCDDRLGLGEGAGVAPAVRHREAVVQQHDVMGPRAAQQVAPLVVQHAAGPPSAPRPPRRASAAAGAEVA